MHNSDFSHLGPGPCLDGSAGADTLTSRKSAPNCSARPGPCSAEFGEIFERCWLNPRMLKGCCSNHCIQSEVGRAWLGFHACWAEQGSGHHRTMKFNGGWYGNVLPDRGRASHSATYMYRAKGLLMLCAFILNDNREDYGDYSGNEVGMWACATATTRCGP